MEEFCGTRCSGQRDCVCSTCLGKYCWGKRKREKEAFAGCVFSFVGDPKRAKVLSDRVLERGGRVATARGLATHVVVSRRFADRKIDDVDPAAVLVDPNWISDTVAGTAKKLEDYAIERRVEPVEAAKRSRLGWACERQARPPGAATRSQEVLKPRLRELLDFYGVALDAESEFKARNLRTVLTHLDWCAASLDSVSDAEMKRQLGGFRVCGDNTVEKIRQILDTDTCDRLDEFRSDPASVAAVALAKVWGIGPTTARALFAAHGISTVAELRCAVARDPSIVESRVLKTLARYEDLLERMPRYEARAIFGETKAAAEKAAKTLGCTKVDAVAAGSFRRGKKDCGDVDVLLTWRAGAHNTHAQRARVLSTIVEELGDFLTDHLTDASPSDGEDDGPASYMGICRLRDAPKHRRIDIKVYHPDQWPFALLYFTGSDHYNRSLRHLAKQKGYSLSDQGLYRHNADSSKSPVLEKFLTEEDVCRYLEVRYREPHDRDCAATIDDNQAAAKRLRSERHYDADIHRLDDSPCSSRRQPGPPQASLLGAPQAGSQPEPHSDQSPWVA